MSKSKKIAIAMIVFAVICFALSVVTLAKATKFIREGEEADATITKILSYTSGDDLEHEVTVTFTTSDGQEITGILDTYSSSFYEGEVIPIRYLTKNPHEFTYGKTVYLPVVILAGVGVILIVTSVVKLVRGDDDDGSGEFRGKIDDSQKDNW